MRVKCQRCASNRSQTADRNSPRGYAPARSLMAFTGGVVTSSLGFGGFPADQKPTSHPCRSRPTPPGGADDPPAARRHAGDAAGNRSCTANAGRSLSRQHQPAGAHQVARKPRGFAHPVEHGLRSWIRVRVRCRPKHHRAATVECRHSRLVVQMLRTPPRRWPTNTSNDGTRRSGPTRAVLPGASRPYGCPFAYARSSWGRARR